MVAALNVDECLPTRDLLRVLRTPPSTSEAMPESLQWQAFLELRKRGEATAASLFIQSLKLLHRRRTMGTNDLPLQDANPDEHRLAYDPYVGELWKSYKRCLLANRTGPAAQILRELESQIC